MKVKTTYLNLQSATKSVLIWKFIAQNACIIEEKSFHINDFSFYLKKLENRRANESQRKQRKRNNKNYYRNQ